VSETKYITAEELGLDLGRLPQSDHEAEERFEKWKETDPFPEIEPALLNSADLFDYLSTVGMVHPLDINPLKVDETLKPASCGIRIGGTCIYWAYEPDREDPKQKTTIELDHNGVLTLPPNSIVYATIAPTIRLPKYIAARFNLSIKYVYHGLLVGTGPLVDPGFDRKIHIPLHNLTSSSCKIPASDAVLWMEFTKLSPHESWNKEGRTPEYGRYVSFPARKTEGRPGFDAYITHATGGEPVLSSIPEQVGVASTAAKDAAEQAKMARRSSLKFQAGTAAAIALAVTAVIIGIVTYINDVQNGVTSDANTAVRHSNELERELNRVRDRLRRVESNARAVGS
jgi:deoxycytidine triphosphate deaminase